MDYEPDPVANPGLPGPAKSIWTLKNRMAVKGKYPLKDPQQSYIDEVTRLLDEIRATTIGANLVNAIIAENHMVDITMPSKMLDEGMRAVKCSPSATEHGAATDIYILLVGEVVRGNPAAARTELAAALAAAQAVGHTHAAVAAEAIRLSQSAAAVQSCSSPTGPPQPIPARNLTLTGPMITNWSTGAAAIADGYNLRYLALALERFLNRGTGAPSGVKFDPWITCDGLIKRPPIVSLFHELVHVYHNVKGMTIFTPGGQEEIEMMYIPCGAFGTLALGGPARLYTENAFRHVLHKANRQYV